MPKHPPGGLPGPPQRWREYVDAALYVLRTGCAWPHLPHDFTVSWTAVHKHFLRWCRTRTNHCLRLDRHHKITSKPTKDSSSSAKSLYHPTTRTQPVVVTL